MKIFFYSKLTILAYLFFILFLILVGLYVIFISDYFKIFSKYSILFGSILIGGIGGIVYCLKAIYYESCVKDNWSNKWAIWYYIRPWNSLIMGGISWLFLKSGLLILEGSSKDSAGYGFYALAFIAGLNVDKFLKKIEETAKTIWGIEKSNMSKK